MMRNVLILSALALSACATPAQRMGYDTPYGTYSQSREAELRGMNEPLGAQPPDANGPQVITGADLAAAGIGGAQGASPMTAPVQQPMGEAPLAGPIAMPGGHTGISDEQDFGAVSSRESIESDAQRIAAQREAYRVIPPEPVPDRPADTGPNIVSFALSTTNQPGEQVYSRGGISIPARFERNCAKYPSPDKAQEAFLEAGGPQRDRMGIDPDGDGFACYWDPRPFRAARAG